MGFMFFIIIIFIIFLLTDWVTDWLLQKLRVIQLVKFHSIYGTRRFITVFTGACHWSLFRTRRIHSTPFHQISIKSIEILFSHLRISLPSDIFLNVTRPKFCMHFHV
jgi:hypothetical protein